MNSVFHRPFSSQLFERLFLVLTVVNLIWRGVKPGFTCLKVQCGWIWTYSLSMFLKSSTKPQCHSFTTLWRALVLNHTGAIRLHYFYTEYPILHPSETLILHAKLFVQVSRSYIVFVRRLWPAVCNQIGQCRPAPGHMNADVNTAANETRAWKECVVWV